MRPVRVHKPPVALSGLVCSWFLQFFPWSGLKFVFCSLFIYLAFAWLIFVATWFPVWYFSLYFFVFPLGVMEASLAFFLGLSMLLLVHISIIHAPFGLFVFWLVLSAAISFGAVVPSTAGSFLFIFVSSFMFCLFWICAVFFLYLWRRPHTFLWLFCNAFCCYISIWTVPCVLPYMCRTWTLILLGFPFPLSPTGFRALNLSAPSACNFLIQVCCPDASIFIPSPCT